MASETYDGVAMGDNRTLWRFFDGSSSISASMLVAVLINGCGDVCGELWGIRLLKGLTEQEAGVIILATLLLFPTTTVLYGGAKLIFAAKEAVEKKAEQKGRAQGLAQGLEEGQAKGRAEGLSEGRVKERKRIRAQLEQSGNLTPELARILSAEENGGDA